MAGHHNGLGERRRRGRHRRFAQAARRSVCRAIRRHDGRRSAGRRDDKGEVVAGQPTVLIILDCCYSGRGGMEMLGNALRGMGNPNTWVIASASDLQYARQGIFAAAFADALRRPTTGSSQRFLNLETVVQAVNDARPSGAEQEARVFPPATGSRGIPAFLPNPYYQPGVAGLTISEQHWLSRLRGGPEDSTTGFYLTGRTGRLRASEDLARWMTDPGRGGLAVVTGSPGTGKSALLALPVLLNQPSGRQDLLRAAEPGSLIQRMAALLPVGTPNIAVHARGLNIDQAAARIAEGLHRHADGAAALLEDLDTTPEPGCRVVVVDAIDEATSPETLLGSLLLPLARQPGLKVAVGVRRHVLSQIGQPQLTIDLDTENYRDPKALTDYVHQLLIASSEPGITTPYQHGTSPAEGNRAEIAVTVATAIAQQATARGTGAESFLIGRLLALSVRARARVVDTGSNGWQTQLPASVGAAFDEDLARLGHRTPVARLLLEALAWAKGPGLPWENLWVPVAQALADQHHRPGQSGAITDEDVRWLADKAVAYFVEDLGPGGARCSGRFTTCSPPTCAASQAPNVKMLIPQPGLPGRSTAPGPRRPSRRRCSALCRVMRPPGSAGGPPILTCGPTSRSTPRPPDPGRCRASCTMWTSWRWPTRRPFCPCSPRPITRSVT